MEYIKIPKQISFKELMTNTSFSSLNYAKVLGANTSIIPLRELMYRGLTTSDKGVEVGSQSYIHKSDYFFIRTKTLQPEYFLPLVTPESTRPILPTAFIDIGLKKGDILMSKDSNIGEVVILDRDYPNYMVSGGIYKLPIIKNKHYIFAFLKSDFFKTQLNFLASKGSTIRHAKTLFLDCMIPFPNGKESDLVIEYVETLVRAIINKEQAIKNGYAKIIELIDTELVSNQKSGKFVFNYPKLEELRSLNRINAGIYSRYFKENEFKIKNYRYGYKSIQEHGFKISRGQNLQVSAIGKSVYSDSRKENFYTLILPKNISLFGTVKRYEYLGSQGKLKTLKSGDIIFGAEGFEKGRSIVIFEDLKNAITNIHGITLNHSGRSDFTFSIFIKCFLDYLRNIELVDLYAAGGNGGSLAKHYWDVIPFPNFPEEKQKEIAKIYYNSPKRSMSNSDFLAAEAKWDALAGIVQIDDSYKKLKNHLEKIIAQIINNESVKVDFSVLG